MAEEKLCAEVFWRIENFSWYFKVPNTIGKINTFSTYRSQRFVVNTLDATECRMRLDYPCKICFETMFQQRDFLVFQFSVLNNKGLPVLNSERKSFKFEDKFEIYSSDLFRRNEYLPNNVLTIRCRIWMTALSNEVFYVFICSSVKQYHSSFDWDIKDYYRTSRTDKIAPITLSPNLELGENTHSFTISYRRRECDRSKFSLKESILVEYRGIGEGSFCLKCSFVLRDSEEMYLITDVNYSTLFHWWTFEPMLKQNYFVERSLPNNVLKLKCDFSVFCCEYSPLSVWGFASAITIPSWAVWMKDSCQSLQSFENRPTYDALKRDLSQLYRDRCMSDFTISVHPQKYSVHSNILGARSPVFRAMFESKMKEQTSRVVQITDLEPDTVDRMLNYIYTDDPGKMSEDICLKLFYAADKYQLRDLKHYCFDFMKQNINTTNVCVILEMAERHQDRNLKAEAIKYISRHKKEVMVSGEWKSLMESNSNLTSTTMLRLITQ